MTQPWERITDDELLNYDRPNTAEIAQYDRIMTHKLRSTIMLLNQGLSSALAQTNQRIHDESGKIIRSNLEIAKSQERLQRWSVILSIVIAVATSAYVWVTYLSVAAAREANTIQREMLTFQRAPKVLVH